MGLVFVLVLVVLLVASGIRILGSRLTPGGSVARIRVDDLAVGRSPDVCAVTGVPTTHRVEVSSTDGGFSPWWLALIFLGPIGWVGLALLVALARRPGRVSGILPVAPAALDRYNAMVQVARRATLGMVGVLVAGAIGMSLVNRMWSGAVSWAFTAFVVAMALAAITALVASVIAPFRWIDLELDGSGRWVTVRRAAPEFAEAARRLYEPLRTT